MSEKLDVYSRVTNKIIADLERGNLTWLQPWQAGHKAGPVSRPLRAAGQGVPWRQCADALGRFHGEGLQLPFVG
jgi:hypothetical protein